MGQKFMSRRGLATTLGLAGVVAMAGSHASSTGARGGNRADIARTRLQVTALRDAFVKEAIAAGFECAIQPPRIVVEDVPSFGMYDPETNTLTTVRHQLRTARTDTGLHLVPVTNGDRCVFRSTCPDVCPGASGNDALGCPKAVAGDRLQLADQRPVDCPG